MSPKLDTLDGRSGHYRALDPNDIRQPELSFDDLTHACSQIALEMATESIVFVSVANSRLIHANRAACHCLGYSRQQLRLMSLLDIAPQASTANLTEIFRRAMGSANQEARVRTVYRQRSGSLVPIRCSIRALRMLPENILLVVGQGTSARNVTNSRCLNASLRDSLTLLPNREWLWRQLEREVRSAQQSDYQFAVLFIDIDRFKDINDSHGHLAGDQVLQAVARRLTASVRPVDTVTRYGGDEFVILMKKVQGEGDIRRIVERIGRCVEAVGKLRGEKEWQARVTVSIGVAISSGEEASSVDAVERADRAMYRAKALGRNGQFVIDVSPKIPVDQRKFARGILIGQDRSNELD